jgi:hypothetical protein
MTHLTSIGPASIGLGRAARPRAAGPPTPQASACAVCGAQELSTDEVFERRGLWLLGECGRCGHRWTAGPFGATPAPAMVRPPPVEEDDAAVA